MVITADRHTFVQKIEVNSEIFLELRFLNRKSDGMVILAFENYSILDLNAENCQKSKRALTTITSLSPLPLRN